MPEARAVEMNPSSSMIFEDARSEMDEGEVQSLAGTDKATLDLDRILSLKEGNDPSSVLDSHLTALELESSRKVRKRYGLPEDGRSRTPSEALSEVRSISLIDGRDAGREIAIIYETAQFLVERFLEELVEGSIVDEHPLLGHFLVLLEIALQHGWRGAVLDRGFFASVRMNIWDLLKRLEKHTSQSPTLSVLANVRQFSALRNSASRLRVWIRLSIMSKCFTNDLTLLLSNESGTFS